MFDVASPCNYRVRHHGQQHYLELLSYEARNDMVQQLREQGFPNLWWFAEYRYFADSPCFYLGVVTAQPGWQPTISKLLTTDILLAFDRGIHDWLNNAV